MPSLVSSHTRDYYKGYAMKERQEITNMVKIVNLGFANGLMNHKGNNKVVPFRENT